MAVTSVVVLSIMSLVVLSPNIARTRPRSNAYFPRSTVECFGENRPNRKAFSTSFSEMNLHSILHAPCCVSASGFDVNFERILNSWSFLSFSFWTWNLARKAAHDARTMMETIVKRRPKHPPPFSLLLFLLPFVPFALLVFRSPFWTFLANVFFFFCRLLLFVLLLR